MITSDLAEHVAHFFRRQTCERSRCRGISQTFHISLFWVSGKIELNMDEQAGCGTRIAGRLSDAMTALVTLQLRIGRFAISISIFVGLIDSSHDVSLSRLILTLERCSLSYLTCSLNRHT